MSFTLEEADVELTALPPAAGLVPHFTSSADSSFRPMWLKKHCPLLHVMLLLSCSRTLALEQWQRNPCRPENSISSYDESYFGSYTSFLFFLPTFDQHLAFNTLNSAIAALQCLPEASLQTMSLLNE